jgi:hypothetical protein
MSTSKIIRGGLVTALRTLRNLFCVIALTLPTLSTSVQAVVGSNELINGLQWADTNGNPINAHGGGMIKVGEYYYLFGENRQADNHFESVACYRSSDLVNWEFVSHSLTKDSHPDLYYSWIERPKVIYNAKTNKYVMWMHWENGDHYGEAKAGVAVADNVAGPYTYVKTFRPYEDRGVYDGWEQKPGYMSRDSTLFLDDDGKGYFITSSNDNKDMRFFLLTEDFLDVDRIVATHFAGQSRESPALFKRNGVYFVVTSGTTGWSPNQQKYAWSYSLESGWSWMYNVGDFWGFASQSTYVQPVQSSTGSTSYMYMGDRWAGAWGKGVNDGSGYVWLPIHFPTDTSMEMHWNNTISIDLTRDNPVQGHTKKFRLKNVKSGLYLDVNKALADKYTVMQKPYAATGTTQLWDLAYKGRGDFYLYSINKNQVIDMPDWSTTAGTNVGLWWENDGNNQRWHLVEKNSGTYALWNSHSGKYLQVENGSTKSGAAIEQGNYQENLTSQRWIIETAQ